MPDVGVNHRKLAPSMSAETAIHIVVLGAAGLIGVRHVQHIVNEPLAELSGIVDPTPAGAELAKKHTVPCYASVDDLIQARDKGEIKVDAAIVATPNHTHVPISIKLIDNDISALIEKPVAVDGASANAVLKAVENAKARSSPARALVGHHRRFNTYIRAAKKAIANNSLGQIIAFQGIWTLLKDLPYFTNVPWRTQVGSGGPILTNLIHEVDNLRYLLGDIERVYVEPGVSTRGFEVEETVAMTLRFTSGTVGTIVLSDACASPYNWESASGENPNYPPAHQNVYTILGTKGSLSVPELRRWHYDMCGGKGSWTDPIEQDDSLKAEADSTPPLTLQLRHLIAVHKGLEQPNCSALEGTKSLLVVEAVINSMKTREPMIVGTPEV